MIGSDSVDSFSIKTNAKVHNIINFSADDSLDASGATCYKLFTCSSEDEKCFVEFQFL